MANRGVVVDDIPTRIRPASEAESRNTLRWPDLDREARTIEVRHTLSWAAGKPVREESKTVAGQRTIRLPDTLWDALTDHERRQEAERVKAGDAWLGIDPYVFTRRTGAPMRGDGTGGAGHQFKTRLLRAGIEPRNCHQLRDLGASLRLSLNGNNLVEVGQILGHSTYRHTTDIYGHLRPEVSSYLAAQINEYFTTRATAVEALRASNGASDRASG